MQLERNSELFKKIYNNYWKYYIELECDFLETQRYVEFSENNYSTYSMEYLKLYQALCSEIDVVGKAMAKMVDDSFREEDSKNNILKWWYKIQDIYFLTDGPFTLMNDTATTKNYSMVEYKCNMLGYFELHPWNKYRTEEYTDRRGRIRYRVSDECESPKWWRNYNKVKHGRIHVAEIDNYKNANLENVSNAIAALYVLERAAMDTIGMRDDLECFKLHSRIFSPMRKWTRKEMDEIFANYKTN